MIHWSNRPGEISTNKFGPLNDADLILKALEEVSNDKWKKYQESPRSRNRERGFGYSHNKKGPGHVGGGDGSSPNQMTHSSDPSSSSSSSGSLSVKRRTTEDIIRAGRGQNGGMGGGDFLDLAGDYGKRISPGPQLIVEFLCYARWNFMRVFIIS